MFSFLKDRAPTAPQKKTEADAAPLTKPDDARRSHVVLAPKKAAAPRADERIGTHAPSPEEYELDRWRSAAADSVQQARERQ